MCAWYICKSGKAEQYTSLNLEVDKRTRAVEEHKSNVWKCHGCDTIFTCGIAEINS